MRNYYLFFLLFIQFSFAQVDIVYSDLVWWDEFNTAVGSPVDSNKWHHQTQVIIPNIGWANNEQQHYTNRTSNSYVFGGFLNIVAKRENFSDQGLTKQFTSARLNSKFAFTYGRVDVRAKIPMNAGTWPAIWLLGKNIFEPGAYWHNAFGAVGWPACGEIDIMEHGIFPSEDINYINSAIHTPCCNGGNPNQGGTILSNLGNDYHIYSVNWSPNQLTFLIDNVAFYTYNPPVKNDSTWPFNKDQYILLNVAMGGLAGTVDPSIDISGVTMSVDYVRVYQNNPLSVEDEELAHFKVFPNPADTEINISSKLPIEKVELYDIFGKLILNKVKNTNKIDTTNLRSGIYLLNIYSNDKKTIKKVVVN